MNVEDFTNFSKEEKMRRSVGAILLVFAMAGVLYPVSAMNGKAVTVVTQAVGPNYEFKNKCYLVISTIVSNKVTATDTILRSDFY